MQRSIAASVSGISSGSQSTVCDGPSRGQADEPCRAGMKASTRSASREREPQVRRCKAEARARAGPDIARHADDLGANQRARHVAERRLVEIDQPLDVRGHRKASSPPTCAADSTPEGSTMGLDRRSLPLPRGQYRLSRARRGDRQAPPPSTRPTPMPSKLPPTAAAGRSPTSSSPTIMPTTPTASSRSRESSA